MVVVSLSSEIKKKDWNDTTCLRGRVIVDVTITHEKNKGDTISYDSVTRSSNTFAKDFNKT